MSHEHALARQIEALDRGDVNAAESARLVGNSFRVLRALNNRANIDLLFERLLRSPLWDRIDRIDLAYRIVSLRKYLYRADELASVYAPSIERVRCETSRKTLLLATLYLESDKYKQAFLRNVAGNPAELVAISYTEERTFDRDVVRRCIHALLHSPLRQRTKELGVYTKVIREMLDETEVDVVAVLQIIKDARQPHLLTQLGILERVSEQALLSRDADRAARIIYDILTAQVRHNAYPQWQACFAIASDILEDHLDLSRFAQQLDEFSLLVLETHAKSLPPALANELLTRLDSSELALSLALAIHIHFDETSPRLPAFIDTLFEHATDRQLRIALPALYRAHRPDVIPARLEARAAEDRYLQAYIDVLPAIPRRELMHHLEACNTHAKFPERFIQIITTEMDPDRAEVVVRFLDKYRERARL